MENIFRDLMGVKTLEVIPTRGGGIINEGRSVQTERGKFFVKMNTKSGARTMFEGERVGLETILATGIVRCPRPIEVYDLRGDQGSILTMEHLELEDLDRHAVALGEAVARLHLHNGSLKLREARNNGRIGSNCVSLEEHEGEKESKGYVSQFGFKTTTCCGYLPLDNTWNDDWVNFFVRQRLKPRVDYIEQEFGDRTLIELWPRLVRHIPRFFCGTGRIIPALLHGDFHGENVAETMTGPVIYDPACFYGHHEFELAATRAFVDFNQEFFPAYHRLIPKAAGFDEREKLYKLFFYLNHWNHLGPKHKDKVMALFTQLLAE